MPEATTDIQNSGAWFQVPQDESDEHHLAAIVDGLVPAIIRYLEA